MCDAGYPCGLLIAPVIIMEGWKEEYRTLLQTLRDHLSPKMKREMFLEVILMTYSFVGPSMERHFRQRRSSTIRNL